MKKLIIFTIILLPLFCVSQNEVVDQIKNPDVLSDFFKGKYFTLSEVVSNYKAATITNEQLEVEFIRFCNRKEYKQRKTAYLLGAGSVALAFTNIYLTNKDLEKNSRFTEPNEFIKYTEWGTWGFGIASALVFLNSEKWNNYSSIKPSRNGVGVIITF